MLYQNDNQVSATTSIKKIVDYRQASSPRRPRHLLPTGGGGGVGGYSHHQQAQDKFHPKRITSLQNIGIILEKVINHTAKNSSRKLLKYDLSKSSLRQNNNNNLQAPTSECLISNSAASTPKRQPSQQQIKFLDGSTSLLFSATKQQLMFRDDSNSQNNGHFKLFSSPRDPANGRNNQSSLEDLLQTSQIKVKINKDGTQPPGQVTQQMQTSGNNGHNSNGLNDIDAAPIQQQYKNTTQSLLKHSTLTMMQSSQRSVNGNFRHQQEKNPGQITTVNINKAAGKFQQQDDQQRNAQNITPSTVYNPQLGVTATDGSLNASTTYQAPNFRPTLSPINLEAVPSMLNLNRDGSQICDEVKDQTKQIQNMMVNMLKQQVKKRRKLHKKGEAAAGHQPDDDPSEISHHRHSKSVMQASPLKLSQPDDDLDGFANKIVFNVISPRMPTRKIQVTTSIPLQQIGTSSRMWGSSAAVTQKRNQRHHHSQLQQYHPKTAKNLTNILNISQQEQKQSREKILLYKHSTKWQELSQSITSPDNQQQQIRFNNQNRTRNEQTKTMRTQINTHQASSPLDELLHNVQTQPLNVLLTEDLPYEVVSRSSSNIKEYKHQQQQQQSQLLPPLSIQEYERIINNQQQQSSGNFVINENNDSARGRGQQAIDKTKSGEETISPQQTASVNMLKHMVDIRANHLATNVGGILNNKMVLESPQTSSSAIGYQSSNKLSLSNIGSQQDLAPQYANLNNQQPLVMDLFPQISSQQQLQQQQLLVNQLSTSIDITIPDQQKINSDKQRQQLIEEQELTLKKIAVSDVGAIRKNISQQNISSGNQSSYTVHKHDILMPDATNTNVNNDSFKMALMKQGNRDQFVLKSEEQTLEERSGEDRQSAYKEGRYAAAPGSSSSSKQKDSLKPAYLQQQQMQSTSLIDAGGNLNDYQWNSNNDHKNINVQLQKSNSNGTAAHLSNNKNDQNLPPIHKQNQFTTTLQGANVTPPSSQPQTTNAKKKGRNDVYSTQQSYSKLIRGDAVGAGEYGISPKGSQINLKRESAADSASISSNNLNQGTQIGEVMLPSLVIDDVLPSFFDHNGGDQQSSSQASQHQILQFQHQQQVIQNNSRSQVLLPKQQHNRNHRSNPATAQSTNTDQNNQIMSIQGQIGNMSAAYISSERHQALDEPPPEQLRNKKSIRGGSMPPKSMSCLDLQKAAAMAGKGSQFILRQMMRQKHNMATASAALQRSSSRQRKSDRMRETARQIHLHLQPLQEEQISPVQRNPLTSLEHYYKEKQNSSSNKSLSSSQQTPLLDQSAVQNNNLPNPTTKSATSTSLQPVPKQLILPKMVQSQVLEESEQEVIYSPRFLTRVTSEGTVVEQPSSPKQQEQHQTREEEAHNDDKSKQSITISLMKNSSQQDQEDKRHHQTVSSIGDLSLQQVPQNMLLGNSITKAPVEAAVVVESSLVSTLDNINNSNHLITSTLSAAPTQQQLATFKPFSDQTSNADEVQQSLSKANVDDISESIIFTLRSPRQQVDEPGKVQVNLANYKVKQQTIQNKEFELLKNQNSHQKWKRFTFSNLDKLAAKNSYLLPFKSQELGGQSINDRQKLQNQAIPPQNLYQKKSAIQQLLEVNGKLPKASAKRLPQQQQQQQQYQLTLEQAMALNQLQQRSANSMSPLLISNISNNNRSFKGSQNHDLSPVSHTITGGPLTQQQHLQRVSQLQTSMQNTLKTGNDLQGLVGYEQDNDDDGDAFLVDQDKEGKSTPSKTRIFLSKINNIAPIETGESTRKLLKNDKINGWSPVQSIYSEGVVASPRQTREDFISWRTNSFNEYINSANNVAFKERMWPSTSNVAKLNETNRGGGEFLDQKNMTGKSSDFNPDLEYETQYLSQVSRYRFMDAKVSSSANNNNININTEAMVSAKNLRKSQPNVVNDGEDFDRDEVVQYEQEEFFTGPGIKIRSKRKPQTDDLESLHKRLQDIAWRIKHHKRLPLNDEDLITKKSRSTSQGTLMRSKQLQGLKTDQKLQMNLIKHVNNNDFLDSYGHVISHIQASGPPQKRTSSNKKEFKSIHIQNWNAKGLPFPT